MITTRDIQQDFASFCAATNRRVRPFSLEEGQRTVIAYLNYVGMPCRVLKKRINGKTEIYGYVRHLKVLLVTYDL